MASRPAIGIIRCCTRQRVETLAGLLQNLHVNWRPAQTGAVDCVISMLEVSQCVFNCGIGRHPLVSHQANSALLDVGR
jgi:hypothetical protein